MPPVGISQHPSPHAGAPEEDRWMTVKNTKWTFVEFRDEAGQVEASSLGGMSV